MNNKIKNKLIELEKEYKQLETKLQSKEILKNIAQFAEIKKKLQLIENKVNLFQEWRKVEKEINDWKIIFDKESDLKVETLQEIKKNEKKRKKLEQQITNLFIKKTKPTKKFFIVEIRGAAGGEEANLFAKELADAYLKLAKKENWPYEMLDTSKTDSGGYAFVSILIKKPDAYQNMRYESGVHRIQRIPKTESQGRIHTSTATVAVMPIQEEKDMPIDSKDLRIDTFRSRGAGGQHVNTTDSAIRVTHLPTGISVSCQTGRSQHDNKDRALKILRARLYEREQQFRKNKETDERHQQVGHGMRHEKIRTYNFPQNRVTDHRIKVSVKNIQKVMNGNFETFWNVLKTLDEENEK